MSEALERRFFPFVIKPGRYAGGEPGQAPPARPGDFRILLLSPERYDFGWGGLQLQVLYHLLNGLRGITAERIFAYDRDAEEQLRNESLPAFALESREPLNSFDLLIALIHDWSGFTALLQLLDLAALPFYSRERSAATPLLLGVGPATRYPSPIAPFFDAFLIGECEDLLPELAQALRDAKPSGKEAQRLLLATTQSVYVPSDPPKESIQPARTRELRLEQYPRSPLQPMIEVAAAALPLECSRSDGSNGASTASAIRSLPKQQVQELAKAQLLATGLAELQVVSLPKLALPASEQTIVALAKGIEGTRTTISLPALAPGSFSAAALATIARVKRHGLSLSAESGSERLRSLMHASGTNEDLLDTVQAAYRSGWSLVRLLFRIGLPSETDDDLRATARLIAQAAAIAAGSPPPKKSLQVLLTPFLPTPHTPFQWDELAGAEELLRRFHLLRREIRQPALPLKLLGAAQARVATALMRGDERLADVIVAAYQSGARFDGDFDLFNESLWDAAFQACGHSLEHLCQSLPVSHPLPWRIIASDRTAEQLWEERTAPLRELARARTILSEPEAEPGPLRAATPPAATVGFGRSPKRVAGRNLAAPTKNCVRIRWGKQSRHRYMSHLENLRFFERLIRRSGIPIAWSSGERPTMRLSVGPPLPLGFTSEAEYLDMTLETNCTASMLDAFKAVIPDGFELYEASIVFGAQRSLSSALNRVVYQLPLTEWADLSVVDRQITAIIDAPALLFERESASAGLATVDLKPAIYDLHRTADHLAMTLGIGDGGYVRPTELITFLSESLIHSPLSLPFHRRRLFRAEPDGRIVDPMQV